MKPIEPGAVVRLIKALPEYQHRVGEEFVVEGPQEPIPLHLHPCAFCGSKSFWPLSSGGASCECCITTVDDDPDAVTEPVEQEQTA